MYVDMKWYSLVAIVLFCLILMVYSTKTLRELCTNV